MDAEKEVTSLEQRVIVRGAPALYYCETGILDKLDCLLQPYTYKRVLVVHGDRSLKAAKPFFPKLTKLTLLYLRYNGECTLEEARRIARYAQAEQADVILGVGGGKVMDVVKAAGNEAQLDTILVPTLASNCAAWTPLSVFYNEHGQFTNYTIFPKSTLMVLVEPRIALQAPVAYLRAGIADTLAKWYEADVLIRKLEHPSIAIQIAHHSARLCQSTLLEHGRQSIQDAETKQLSAAFVQVVETIIMTGGMVGGFGDHLGRIAGAHSVHNGLTVAPETHDLLHGDKVAYGILVQLVLEDNLPEVQRLLPFYLGMNLPYRLTDLGLSSQDTATLKNIASGTTHPNESIHFMKSGITADDVYQAIVTLEHAISES
ncbi:iron-containing alcohol dehydrogenase family protein [Paenibacillus profundus]|uniref:iron-containing alcohol dehydrogenase family protein n=1 Tax=Paenibacillus TaxID=44249 RepID=UPI0006850685